jgi:hypothetical protein
MTAATTPVGQVPGPRRLTALEPTECLRLLGAVALGRIVFTADGLPAIRPVNHVLVDGDIVIRTRLGASLPTEGVRRGKVVVAYEADEIDAATHTGWSVVATGVAELVREPAELARYAGGQHGRADQPVDCAIRIRPELVTGYRMAPM